MKKLDLSSPCTMFLNLPARFIFEAVGFLLVSYLLFSTSIPLYSPQVNVLSLVEIFFQEALDRSTCTGSIMIKFYP